MPHAELSFSADLALDLRSILSNVEAVILRHDPDAGECKGRAYPAEVFHHTHCLLSVTMLRRKHRDEPFTQALLHDLEVEMRQHLVADSFLSIGISYSDANYITTNV